MSSVLRMIGGILQARAVAPQVLGLFNGIGLILSYGRFLQLGAINGLNRELPYYIGVGDRRRAEELAAAAQAWAIAVGVVSAAALLTVAGYYLFLGDLQLAFGWAANAPIAFITFVATMYLQATYRTSHDFVRLSYINIAQNALSLALVAIVVLWSFYGLCLRALISGLFAAAMYFHWRPLRIGPKWSLRDLKHLIAVGMPIFAVGEIGVWWTAIDSTLVLKYLGTQGMGLYAMVAVAGSTLDLLPQAVAQVLYPRMAEQYGREHRVSGLIRISIRPMLATFAAMAVFVTAGWYLAGPLTRLILPKYAEAVPAMQWALLTPLVCSFAPVFNVYNVVRRQSLYAVAIGLGMASYFGSLFWLMRNGAALTAFPQAMFVGRAIYILAGGCLLIPLASSHSPQSR